MSIGTVMRTRRLALMTGTRSVAPGGDPALLSFRLENVSPPKWTEWGVIPTDFV